MVRVPALVERVRVSAVGARHLRGRHRSRSEVRVIAAFHSGRHFRGGARAPSEPAELRSQHEDAWGRCPEPGLGPLLPGAGPEPEQNQPEQLAQPVANPGPPAFRILLRPRAEVAAADPVQSPDQPESHRLLRCSHASLQLAPFCHPEDHLPAAGASVPQWRQLCGHPGGLPPSRAPVLANHQGVEV